MTLPTNDDLTTCELSASELDAISGGFRLEVPLSVFIQGLHSGPQGGVYRPPVPEHYFDPKGPIFIR
jgi:hypothetical protein